LLVQDLVNGATITGKYYVALVDKLKQQMASERRRKLSKGILLLQDDDFRHNEAILHEKLRDLRFEFLKHHANSNDLTPSD
jgi:hypothetical protein